MFYIYAYENKISGKIYIGQTIDPNNRDKRHVQNNGVKDNSLIDKKIKQYGRDNFDLWIISIIETKEQANQEEIFWIMEMRDRLGRKMVYNLTDGGDGMSGFRHSEESKKKNSLAHIGRVPANKGKSPNEKTIMKMSSSHIGKNGYWTGKKLSEETRKKKSEAMTGKTWKMIDGKKVWFDKGEKI
jgi:group I intron endonuclease